MLPSGAGAARIGCRTCLAFQPAVGSATERPLAALADRTFGRDASLAGNLLAGLLWPVLRFLVPAYLRHKSLHWGRRHQCETRAQPRRLTRSQSRQAPLTQSTCFSVCTASTRSVWFAMTSSMSL